MDKMNFFSWTKEDMQVLPEVVLHYEAGKTANGFNSESIRSKYSDIRDILMSRYSRDGENAGLSCKTPGPLFTKERLITKIKSLSNKVKGALDTGRKSGGGGLFCSYTDHARNCGVDVLQQNHGIDTSSPRLFSPTDLRMTDNNTSSDSGKVELEYSASSSNESSTEKAGGDVPERRSLLEDLKDSRSLKLRKLLPLDKQMLQFAKDDMAFKSQMLAEMSEGNKANAAQMTILTNSLVNLTKCINSDTQPAAATVYAPTGAIYSSAG